MTRPNPARGIDATAIDPGDIVWVSNPSSSAGAPTYAHRFVVAFRPRILSAGKTFTLVGIASTDDSSFDPLSMVRLPFDAASKSGHSRTGLRQDSAAHVNFTHALKIELVEGKQLLQINCQLDVAPEGMRRHVSAEELQAIVAVFRSYWQRRI